MVTDKKRVLIVDDNADDIRVIMENLREDYAILAATSGEKALALAAKQPQPDVILLDVMMPGMDGYETCRRLKQNPDTKAINVIFISANDSDNEKQAGYSAGGSDYATKPVQVDELRQKVRQALSNKG